MLTCTRFKENSRFGENIIVKIFSINSVDSALDIKSFTIEIDSKMSEGTGNVVLVQSVIDEWHLRRASQKGEATSRVVAVLFTMSSGHADKYIYVGRGSNVVKEESNKGPVMTLPLLEEMIQLWNVHVVEFECVVLVPESAKR